MMLFQAKFCVFAPKKKKVSAASESQPPDRSLAIASTAMVHMTSLFWSEIGRNTSWTRTLWPMGVLLAQKPVAIEMKQPKLEDIAFTRPYST